MGFLPNIGFAQTGNALLEVAPGRTGAGNIDGEGQDASFEQFLDAAVDTLLQGDSHGEEPEMDGLGTSFHIVDTGEDDLAIGSLLDALAGDSVEGHPYGEDGVLFNGNAMTALPDESAAMLHDEIAPIVALQAKMLASTGGTRDGVAVTSHIPVGSVGGNAEMVNAEVSRVSTTPVGSHLAPVDAVDDLLLRVQTAAAMPLDGKATTIITTVPQQGVIAGEQGTQQPVGMRSTALASTAEGTGDTQPKILLAESTATVENQTKPVAIPVSPPSSNVAHKMTTDLNIAAAGQALEPAKGELTLSTALAGSHDESDGQPHSQGKPVIIAKPQLGFPNVDTSEAEALLPEGVSGIARDVKASEPTVLQQPSRIDPQKTLGMTPIENVQELRGVSQVNRGPMAPMADLSDGVQRVEQAIKLSPVTNQQGIRLQLDPPDLGRLVVNLNVHDQRVTTAMITDQPFVRDILVANQHRLESSLQDQGLRMQEFSVDLGRKNMYPGQEQSHDGRTATGGTMTDDGAADLAPEQREEQQMGAGGLNLFA